MIAALLHARNELEKQPDLVRYGVRRRADELEREHDVQRANAFLVNFTRRALPRLELVAAKYCIEAISPDVALPVFDGRDDDVSARYLTTRLVNMTARYNRLADMSKADIDLLAGDIANFIVAELGTVEIQEGSELKVLHASYMCAARITRHFKNAPPLWEKITTKYVTAEDVGPAVLRMATEKWWTGRLRRVAAEWREHLHIALGNVSKKYSAYASKSCVSEWREQKRRTREFIKGMELEDEVTGERISLLDKYDGSVANPAIRRCELMTRIRGFENICNELGYVGEFYTLTAPSKFHATTKAGYRNSRWNGASPADTQRYLTGLWARIRAKLHRDDIRIFGIRVAEPHHDATPHWHMLMFMLPEDVDRVRAVITRYAREEDHHELKSEKARKARFHAEAIDPDKGSATGYVAKYISKNIDGYALDEERDDESGEMLRETAPAVSAWAARWRIRQFQFVGGAPVFEVKGAFAPSRSSVNNCTPEAGPDPAERRPVDLTRPLTRRERRQLTDRLRQREAVKRRTFNHTTAKNGAGIARTIDEIQLLTGETLSRGQALSLMSGAKMCINGKWCRGSGSGEIFAARIPKTALSEAQYKARAERVLAKFNAIRAVG
ncbi:replication endonuclease [Cronobacter dublinensis]|nr:replication endonuclease [Cronobacter dublinensis]